MDKVRDSDRRAVQLNGPTQISDVPLPWLTFEVALYILILLAGLAVRLAALGRWPLQETEANTALAAWRTIQGSTWRPLYYLPLLYDVHLLLFWVTHATDAAARLLPALVGAGLIFVPYFARDILGRKGALTASLLLAFAPTWVFFSRLADGPILTAAVSALILLSVHCYLGSKRAQDLRLGVVALALGLTAGPGIYTSLIAALAFGLLFWWHSRGKEQAVNLRGLLSDVATRDNLLLWVGLFLFFGSGFLLNVGGVGASVELLGRWAGGLAPRSNGLAWWAYPRMLLDYELLTVVLGIAGVVYGLRRRDPFDIYLLFWVGLSLVFGMALGHREPLWLTDALLPLVILAARGLERLWDTLVPETSSADRFQSTTVKGRIETGLTDVLIFLLAGLAVAAGFVRLFAYLQTGQDAYLSHAGITWGLLLAAWVAYLIWGERPSALRVGAALLLLLMITRSVRLTTAVAYQTGRDPREGIAYQPASVQLRDFEVLVSSLSSHQVGDAHFMDIDYEQSLEPWAAWYLRDYPRARAVASVGSQPEATALVTQARTREQRPVGYMGQRFRLQETWSEQGLSSRERLRWLIYREPVGTAQASAEIDLWVRPQRTDN
jgi:uncharacterized protein (TIGR03663 family)